MTRFEQIDQHSPRLVKRLDHQRRGYLTERFLNPVRSGERNPTVIVDIVSERLTRTKYPELAEHLNAHKDEAITFATRMNLWEKLTRSEKRDYRLMKWLSSMRCSSSQKLVLEHLQIECDPATLNFWQANQLISKKREEFNELARKQREDDKHRMRYTV